MTEVIAGWLLGNSLIAGTMAGFVLLTGRLLRPHPRLLHLAWILVLVRLLMPPGLTLPAEALADFATNHAEMHRTAPTETRVDDKVILVFGGAASRPALLDEVAKAFGRGPGHWVAIALCVAWALGAGIVLWRQLHGASQINRLIRRSGPATEPVVRAAQEAARLMEVRLPALCAAAGVKSPFLWGCRRPTLVVPAHLTECDVTVLVHELAHLKRRDVLGGWLATITLAAHWWNPLARVGIRRMQGAAEIACDRHVLERLPAEAIAYARSLLRFADTGLDQHLHIARAAGHSSSELRSRIHAIVDSREVPWHKGGLIAPICALAIGLLPAQSFTYAAGLQQPDQERERRGVDSRLLRGYAAADWSAILSRRDDNTSGEQLESQGLALMALSRFDEAVVAFEAQRQSGFAIDRALYNLACSSALLGNEERAIAFLDAAVVAGFAGASGIQSDPDLTALHGLPEFQAIVLATKH